MASKVKFFSWSKGRQPSEYRTGGLLEIDTNVSDTSKETFLANDAANTSIPGRRRPPNLNLTIPSDHRYCHQHLSPASALHNAALVNSASNLLAVVNDMLRSPALSATLCPRSAEIHKPLPNRPRSVSLPSPAEPAFELPGSILLEAQGFASPPVAGPASRSTLAMRSVRSGNSLSYSATTKPSPSKVLQHKKSLSEASLQRRTKSRPSLITSPSSTDSKITTCSVSTNGGPSSGGDSTKAIVGSEKPLQPSPLIVEGKSWKKGGGDSSNRRDEVASPGTPTPTPTTARVRQIEELKATITAQDNTITTLQTQFSSLRASHEAHVSRLVDAHTAEVASLKDYAKVLEEQQSQRTLHHASSNHLLLFLDPNETQSPTRESPQNTAGSTSANSIRSFKSAFEQPVWSPQQPKDSPEMENLKRKLSSARRPETGHRDAIRELNLYKQNNAALQKQIESLMAKLNQSKTNERNLTTALEKIEKDCTTWQEKARKVDQLEKSTSALQNTIDHLEYRLEMANCEKLDAEEQLFNVQSHRAPFDPIPPKLDTSGSATLANDRQSVRTSMSTVFSSGSPTSHAQESRDPTTLAAFIAHIERLQEQIKQKDARNTDFERENEHLRHDYDELVREHKEMGLQLDIQERLLKKSTQTDVHIEQLRTAIIDRETIIGEKDKALRMAERQLEHHKLLLHAEIRRHATMSLLADARDDPLPDLTSLASTEDITRWISRLRARLRKERLEAGGKMPLEENEMQVENLKQEIDFYVREIIYYKLDIKGYKSDIKKLKHIATRMGSYGSRASDISADTPTRARFSSGTPGPGISNTPSPISTGPISASVPIGRPITPPTLLTPNLSPSDTTKPAFSAYKPDVAMPMTPQTPPRRAGINLANEADNVDPGISPRSVARLSPERRKPTPPSPDQEKFGDLATSFPLSTPAAPKRNDTQRSMSDSIIQLYATPRTPEWSPASNQKLASSENRPVTNRQRSASVPDPSNDKSTPERPPRPQYGLYESTRTPPRVDVMAEAMRNSPDGAQKDSQALLDRSLPNPSTAGLRGLSNSNLSRTNSSTSASAIPAPLTLRSRAGSAQSSTTAIPSSPQRKLSNGSGSNVPFIIGMPSPHNMALISPTTTFPPTTCSITGKSALLKAQSPTSTRGVGGTMASSTPLTSPMEHTDAGKTSYFGGALPVAKGNPTRSWSAAHSRNASVNSVSSPNRKDHDADIRNGGHSRNVSGSSIRSAMQLPSSLMKGKGKARKESISHPRPLASPFDIDRSDAGNNISIGQAM